ncbi:MAG: aspartate kinase [Candidatus Hydrogenedentota bacterium]|nr:MAG: aspartate kinase [Candidatus Hydrogenedentota bacterium]
MSQLPILVQKYGGTSVGSTDRIKAVAERIASYVRNGHKLVVVVSAMGKTTDELVRLAYEITAHPHKREMDMLLSTGEQVSIALLAMALHEIGVSAVSFTAAQVHIKTDQNFSNARIEKIETDRLLKAFQSYDVCIVAGFQGVDADWNITTLGRGGSDTSAVALAAALKASECEIFTDVDGVYTADPNKVPRARKLDQIAYDEMLELASLGAGVLHSRAVEFAKKYNVRIHVRSSFNFTKGTQVVPEEEIMEKLLVTGVTLKNDEARVSVQEVPDRPGIAAELFTALAEKNINVDIIVQSTGQDKKNTISFTVPMGDVQTAQEVIENVIQKWEAGTLSIDTEIAVVSAVGVGMKSHSGIAAKMFQVLADHGINIEMITTSEIKISCVIAKKHGEEALRLIHSIFDLDAPQG